MIYSILCYLHSSSKLFEVIFVKYTFHFAYFYHNLFMKNYFLDYDSKSKLFFINHVNCTRNCFLLLFFNAGEKVSWSHSKPRRTHSQLNPAMEVMNLLVIV